MRHRFFLSSELPIGALVELSGSEFHHAVRVSRIRVGEEIELFDGAGVGTVAVVRSIGDRSLGAEILTAADSRESEIGISLVLGLIALDRFELVLQKGTELGVRSFTPLVCDHGEIRPERVAGKRSRWEKIVLEAVKQCGRSRIPRIAEPQSLEEALNEPRRRILFDAEADGRFLGSWPVSEDVALFIGPEGGWSERELDLARGAKCWIRSLGPRRLRAETAAIAATVVVSLELVSRQDRFWG